MSRQMREPLSATLVRVEKGEAAPTPAPGQRDAPPALKRVPMTFRITETAYEKLRRRAFEMRVSQQALVDQALDQFLTEHHHG